MDNADARPCRSCFEVTASAAAWAQGYCAHCALTFGLRQDAPATMPRVPGLFEPVELPARKPSRAVGQAAAPTPSMFDEQPGDLPGQRSILDDLPD